jgi:hypothetical protein
MYKGTLFKVSKGLYPCLTIHGCRHMDKAGYIYAKEWLIKDLVKKEFNQFSYFVT